MAVYRKEKVSNYTRIDNGHFKTRKLSLKAIGLLDMMLSFPDDWSYSISGLTSLVTDGTDSVKSAIRELEKNGYVRITKGHDSKGKYKYTFDIFESPELNRFYGNGFAETGLPSPEAPGNNRSPDSTDMDNQRPKNNDNKRLNINNVLFTAIGSNTEKSATNASTTEDKYPAGKQQDKQKRTHIPINKPAAGTAKSSAACWEDALLAIMPVTGGSDNDNQ